MKKMFATVVCLISLCISTTIAANSSPEPETPPQRRPLRTTQSIVSPVHSSLPHRDKPEPQPKTRRRSIDPTSESQNRRGTDSTSEPQPDRIKTVIERRPVRYPRYESYIDMDFPPYLYGSGDYSLQSIAIGYIGGCRFNRTLFFGLGMEYYSDMFYDDVFHQAFAPYLHLRTYFLKGVVQPFLGFSLGAIIGNDYAGTAGFQVGVSSLYFRSLGVYVAIGTEFCAGAGLMGFSKTLNLSVGLSF